jgi:hypothetical protein
MNIACWSSAGNPEIFQKSLMKFNTRLKNLYLYLKINTKRMKKLILFLTIVNIMSLFSCKKDEVLSKTELLCRAPWILSASTFTPGIFFEGYGLITDYYSVLPDCAKDDLMDFDEDGNYTQEDGTKKCDPLDPTIFDYGTWAFNSDETVVILTSNIYNGSTEYDILELTEQSLKVSSMLVDTLSNTYTWTETYTHQ